MSLTREDATLTAAIVLWVRKNRTLPRQCTITGGENQRLTITGSVSSGKVTAVVKEKNVSVSCEDFGPSRIKATFESEREKVEVNVISNERFAMENLSSGERQEGHFEGDNKIVFEGSYVVQYELY